METYGSDRLRETGGKLILVSPIPKGWRPRTPRTTTSVEHPGTAVLWGDLYYEVLAAEPSHDGGVRYVLVPWREESAMRHVDRYDDESETARIAEHAKAEQRRRQSNLTGFFGIVLGNLPAPVQEHLGSELGVSPSRMTMLSAIPPVVLLGVCIWLSAGAAIQQTASPVPVWLMVISCALVLDSGIRFHVAMSQNRGLGSLWGTALYLLLWAFAPKRFGLVSPHGGRGRGTFTLEASEEVAFRDSVMLRAPLVTLLAPADQVRLLATLGIDYRQHARRVTLFLLMGSLGGVLGLASKVFVTPRVSLVISFALAVTLAVDQLRRLAVLRHGPAGSILAPLVRPFLRDLLERG